MNNNIKTGVGFLIPAVAIISFFSSIIVENYLLGIFFAITGVLVWFLYAAVMQSELPDVTGNVIIVFGVLLSSSVLLKYGWEQNMFGGFIFNPEGGVLSAILLFFSVLLGVLFRNNRSSSLSPHAPNIPIAKKLPSEPVENTIATKGEESLPASDGEYGDYNSDAYAAYYSDYYDFYNDEDEGGE
ncbi:MAG: hypothetical protein H8E56_00940 [Candidatus Marinimicrobia bacterium]|nr:hypothetical protein [Candidatus Neomarinimicrobiota bacterium]